MNNKNKTKQKTDQVSNCFTEVIYYRSSFPETSPLALVCFSLVKSLSESNFLTTLAVINFFR